jgi:hypothetical protein
VVWKRLCPSNANPRGYAGPAPSRRFTTPPKFLKQPHRRRPMPRVMIVRKSKHPHADGAPPESHTFTHSCRGSRQSRINLSHVFVRRSIPLPLSSSGGKRLSHQLFGVVVTLQKEELP